MTTSASKAGGAPATAPAASAPTALTQRDIHGLVFTAEMYGVQLDQLAALFALTERRARAVGARWRARGYADTARLGPGASWLWLTRAGLAACGLSYTSTPPALSRLAHIRAVAAIRLALESSDTYRTAAAHWRSERHLRARIGKVGASEHIPDGEVHWPDAADVPYAGECWAIEAELTAKTVRRTVAIMLELLTRTGDYGCAAAQRLQPAAPPLHARALYLCSSAARPTVLRAREALGTALGAAFEARIEVRDLPPSAKLEHSPRRLSGSAPPGSRREFQEADPPGRPRGSQGPDPLGRPRGSQGPDRLGRSRGFQGVDPLGRHRAAP